MRMQELRAIAKSHSISPGRRSKAELIKAIQSEEGNFDCYSTAYSHECDQGDCLWREDCFETSVKGALS